MHNKMKFALILTIVTLSFEPVTAVNDAVNTNLDFAIPDAPAFELIDVDSSKILRPATVRQLAVSASDFTGSTTSLTKSFSLPRELAIEVAPFRLGRDSLNVVSDTSDGYSGKIGPFLNRLRVSAASKRFEGKEGPTKLAFGLRMSFLDDADLRSADDSYHILAGRSVQVDTSKEKVVKIPEDQIEKTNGVWNNTALEAAVAMRISGIDSTGKDMIVDNVSFWVTGGRGLGDQLQFLLGGRLAFEKLDRKGAFENNWTVATRMYVGNNNSKSFLEAQWSDSRMKGNKYNLFFNSGLEHHLRDNFWLVVSAGGHWNQTEKDWDIQSNMRLKAGLSVP